MRQEPTTRPSRDSARWSRPRRIVLAVASLLGVVILAGACGSASPSASPTTTIGSSTGGRSNATTPTTDSGPSNKGAGQITRPGSKSGRDSSGNETTGTYSVAFAECMRAHGVPNFPNPNGSGLPASAHSGVNPTSTVYQAALNGPCESLAPAGWVSSGRVTK